MPAGVSQGARAEAPSRSPSLRSRIPVRSLPVAAESNTGYDRDRYFGDRRDTHRDCQHTRSEVLQAESRVRTAFTTARGCTVRPAGG